MQRLLNKAKPHKSEHRSYSRQSEPQAQHQYSGPLDKTCAKHVHMAEDSKENLPAANLGSQPAQLQQDRTIMSSSLPLTPAFEGQAAPKIRRSSIPASEDHHLQAFENSGPGRIALAIAPQVAEMKGEHASCGSRLMSLASSSVCSLPSLLVSTNIISGTG